MVKRLTIAAALTVLLACLTSVRGAETPGPTTLYVEREDKSEWVRLFPGQPCSRDLVLKGLKDNGAAQYIKDFFNAEGLVKNPETGIASYVTFCFREMLSGEHYGFVYEDGDTGQVPMFIFAPEAR